MRVQLAKYENNKYRIRLSWKAWMIRQISLAICSAEAAQSRAPRSCCSSQVRRYKLRKLRNSMPGLVDHLFERHHFRPHHPKQQQQLRWRWRQLYAFWRCWWSRSLLFNTQAAVHCKASYIFFLACHFVSRIHGFVAVVLPRKEILKWSAVSTREKKIRKCWIPPAQI